MDQVLSSGLGLGMWDQINYELVDVLLVGAQWRFPSSPSLWTLWGRKEDTDHVPPPWAIWKWSREAEDWAHDLHSKHMLVAICLFSQVAHYVDFRQKNVGNNYTRLAGIVCMRLVTLFTDFLQTPSKKKVEISTISSNYHIEINPRCSCIEPYKKLMAS